jgi:hypothetical protein
MARYNSWDYYSGTMGILVTPQIAMPSEQFAVRFWMYRDAGSYNSTPDLVNVYYSTGGTTVGAILLGIVNRSYTLPPAVSIPNQWYQYEFSLPAGSSGNAHIVFEGISQYGTSIFVDEISVAPTCIKPAGISMAMLSPTTATISWPAPVPAPAGGYAYEIRTGGAPGSGATGLAASGTVSAGLLSATINGLIPVTNYFAYVRSNCNGGNFSLWSSPLQFTTPFIDVNAVVSGTLTSGQSSCYDALQTITVGGTGTPFLVSSGSSVEMIAGQRINYLPGTRVLSGGYMHGYIAPGGPFCPIAPAKVVTGYENEISSVIEQQFFRVYPNPTTGTFTLEQKDDHRYTKITVEVYDLRGNRVLAAEMVGAKKREFSLSTLPVGLYFVKLIAEDYVETIKLIKIN